MRMMNQQVKKLKSCSSCFIKNLYLMNPRQTNVKQVLFQ
uniref:Uncharacterized protein n=1 Tax=Rhizophora mucronata TaxID=61149 RepID=A0A2P2J4V7_RHIMU